MTKAPQLYLATPIAFELSGFADALSAVLDAAPIACVRLRAPELGVDDIRRAIDGLRPLCHARDVPLVIEDHVRLVRDGGLDGVHFTRSSANLSEARAAMDEDSILGVFCGASRHQGLTAGERGADYVAFGPLTAEPGVGDGLAADRALFEWWQAMIELPVVAEGGVAPDAAQTLSGVADFICLGREVWEHPDGATAAISAYGVA